MLRAEISPGSPPPFKVVIPARYASSRLPGKPLLDLAGKPMLWHVHQKALASSAQQVIIATDDPRIARAAERFGGQVAMTASHHRSGTDRIAEVARQQNWPADTLVVNVQGDEPLLPPGLIRQTAAALAAHPRADMATLCLALRDRREVFNPNLVKVTRDAEGFALYFSRAPIPWLRELFADTQNNAHTLPEGSHYRHLGLYAYTVGFLLKFVKLPPAPQESQESLEQLRALYHGARIYLEEAGETPGPGVDTPDDLEKVRALVQ